MKRFIVFILVTTSSASAADIFKKLKPKQEPSPLDKYLSTISTEEVKPHEPQPGSLWTPYSHLTDSASDMRASAPGDLITVVVSESTNVVASGTSSTQRTSSANASVTSLLGPKLATGALANLANASGAQKLDAKGTTTRQTSLTSTLTAHVVRILPGDLLLIEGSKSLQVNSEQQVVTVRGLVRRADITTGNTVASQSVADVEIKVNGKGIVGDAIRRPNLIYRTILALLPF